MLRSRRLAFAAAAVLLGLSACGDAASTTTAGSTPAVIHIGASSGAGGAKIAASEAADRMMMPYQEVTFVYDGSFPDLGATGPAWTLPAGAAADTARVASLAKLLGVEGEVRALPADQGGGFMVGAEDYSTANLTVSSDGMLTWWFNPAPITTPQVGCGYAGSTGSAVDPDVSPDVAPDATSDATSDVAAPETTIALPVCEQPAPPADVPSKDEALTKAKALFADMGYDLTQFEFDSYADEWGANVTAYHMLGGHRSPLQMSVGFGEKAAITWASGTLAEPQAASDYPLVSGDEALVRLSDNSGRWSWYGGPAMMAKGGAAIDVAASTPSGIVAPATPETAAPETVAPAAGDALPAPGDTLPAPEPITVHLNAMRLDLTMVWADDGTIWLLPAYTFTAVDGGEYTVIAVDDSYIQTAETVTPDTVTPDTVTPETVTPDTVVTTVDATELGVERAAGVLVGLTLDEATKVADGNGWIVRVSVLDGEPQIGTADLQPNRANVVVENGTVTAVDSIG